MEVADIMPIKKNLKTKICYWWIFICNIVCAIMFVGLGRCEDNLRFEKSGYSIYYVFDTFLKKKILVPKWTKIEGSVKHVKTKFY